MRLTEICFFIKNNLQKLDLKISPLLNDKYNSKVDNLFEINQVLYQLEKFEILTEDIELLKKVGNIYNIAQKNVVLSNDSINDYKNKISSIKGKLSAILEVGGVTSPKIKVNTICIKMQHTENITDLQSFVKDITLALGQLTNISTKKGTISFAGFESGSDWINFSVSSDELYTYIFSLVSAINIFSNEYLNMKKTFKILEAVDSLHKSQENLEELQTKLFRKYSSDNIFNELTPEEENRVIHSCLILSKRIQEGAKIEHSLLAQVTKTKNESDIDQQLDRTIQDLKLLSEKSSDSSDETMPASIDDNSTE